MLLYLSDNAKTLTDDLQDLASFVAAIASTSALDSSARGLRLWLGQVLSLLRFGLSMGLMTLWLVMLWASGGEVDVVELLRFRVRFRPC